ncbi:MAG: EAL domain-containing protein [Pseudomonadota bacterium]
MGSFKVPKSALANMRPSSIIIYTAIAVICLCVGAGLYQFTPLSLDVSVMVSALGFFAMALADQAMARKADRKHLEQQIAVTDTALQDAFNEIDMIRGRLVALETDTQQAMDATVAPVAQDIQAVGALLAQVTETVADTDHRITALEAQRATAATSSQRPAAPPKPEKVTKKTPAPKPSADVPLKADEPEPLPLHVDHEQAMTAEPPKDEASEALLKRVELAVKRQRIEVSMQSIVTLPHRRARAYATSYSLKLDGAGTLDSAQVPAAAAAAGVADAYAKGVIARALTLADRFAARESASMVFAPVSGDAVRSSSFADWLIKSMTDGRDLAGRLVLEVTQADVRAFSPLDIDLMSALNDLGFRMAVSSLTDVRSDLFDLAKHGFRYLKAPVPLFLGSDTGASSDIHPEDLADLAARNGMDMIVTGVESEAQVVELLDCNLGYAQGNLFARPRIVEVTPRPPGNSKPPVKAQTTPTEPARPERISGTGQSITRSA